MVICATPSRAFWGIIYHFSEFREDSLSNRRLLPSDEPYTRHVESFTIMGPFPVKARSHAAALVNVVRRRTRGLKPHEVHTWLLSPAHPDGILRFAF